MIFLETIIKFCGKNNLIYSIASADKIEFNEEKLNSIPFVNFSVEERLNPKLTLQQANSVILLGVPYYKNEVNCFNTDYHIIVNGLLEELKQELLDLKATQFVIGADTGALFERGFAISSGLGMKAKNTSVISTDKNIGSYFNIGYIITSEKLEPTKPLEKSCLGCDKCVNACPTNSLYKDGETYNCNYKTCISFLTQAKDELTEYEIKSMGTSIYGCEICQKVCPHNDFVEYSNSATKIEPIKLLGLSKKEFTQYRDLPFHWRGLNVIKRNCLISIYNSELNIEEKKNIISKYKTSESVLLKNIAIQLLGML